MSIEEQRRDAAGDTTRASDEATRLVCTHFEDPEAWVRLVFSEVVGDTTVYHFDGFSPTMVERPLVLDYRTRDLWSAALAD